MRRGTTCSIPAYSTFGDRLARSDGAIGTLAQSADQPVPAGIMVLDSLQHRVDARGR